MAQRQVSLKALVSGFMKQAKPERKRLVLNYADARKEAKSGR